MKKSTIYISEEIDNELATKVQVQIQEALNNGYEEIEFRVNSPGGSVVAGLNLYDTVIGLSTVKTTCKIYGVAASAATYVCLACDESYISSNSSFMIHEPVGGMFGDLQSLENDLEYFSNLRNQILAIYASKTGMTPEEIVEKWNPSWYMNANEAVEYKFVDYLVQDNIGETLLQNVQNKVENKDEVVEDASPVLSLKNLLKKTKDLITAPTKAEEFDNEAELKNKLDDIHSKFEALEAENKALREAMEGNKQEFQNKLQEIENERKALLEEIEKQKKLIDETVNQKVNAVISEMSVAEEEIVEPVNTIKSKSIKELYNEGGLDNVLDYLIARRK